MRSQAAAGLSDNLSDGTYDVPEPAQEPSEQERQDAHILLQFRQSLADSTHYLDTNYRRQWEKNIAHFQGRHPAGSKYSSTTYKYRSKIHMPKVRAVAIRWLAAVSSAFFSTRDVTVIEAENQNDKLQAAAAALWQNALQYRLTKTMPWYQTVIGAAQDAFVNDVCVSHNYWKYEEDEDGDVITDTLACDLLPVENIRFSPAADWRDPINDSEYLIHIMPMSVNKVKGKMMAGEWVWASDSTIAAATRPYDSTHNARQDAAQDPAQADTVAGHQIAYVYKCIMREGNTDYIYYVLGTDHLLTSATKLKDVNPKGVGRNYTLGHIDIEAHRAIGQSPVEMMEPLLTSLNDTVNSRKDNINLAMHKRFKVKRNRKVDLPGLMRNVPGGAIMVTEHTDVEEFDTKDVTASSYKEQEFDSAGFDEIAGSFNQGSINTNRRIGETAAGMELLASDVNVVTEYKLEVFVNTWMWPTLDQLLLLEQAYETDFTVMAMAADQAELPERYGVNEITTDMADQNLIMSVNVGVDATNPGRAIDKLMVLVNMGSSLGLPLDSEEIFKEASGRMGYDNGSRFIMSAERQQEQAQGEGPSPEQQAAEAQAQTEQLKIEQAQMKNQIDQQKIELDVGKLQIAQQKLSQDAELAQMKIQADMQNKSQDLAVRREIAEEQSETTLGVELMKDRTTREMADLQADTAIQSKLLDGEVAREANHMKDRQARDAVESKNE